MTTPFEYAPSDDFISSMNEDLQDQYAGWLANQVDDYLSYLVTTIKTWKGMDISGLTPDDQVMEFYNVFQKLPEKGMNADKSRMPCTIYFTVYENIIVENQPLKRVKFPPPRQETNAFYYCPSDNVWTGLQNDRSVAYQGWVATQIAELLTESANAITVWQNTSVTTMTAIEKAYAFYNTFQEVTGKKIVADLNMLPLSIQLGLSKDMIVNHTPVENDLFK